MKSILAGDDPAPLYHQVKTVILREIESGHWKPGERLPTENDLTTKFKVSKITVREALRELSDLGYIRREQGRGTFVQRPPLEQGPRDLTSFTEEMRRHGLPASSRVFVQGLVAAPADVATALRIPPGAEVFRLRRLRLADGEPMGLQTAFLPSALVPGIADVDFAGASLYDVLRGRYDLSPVRATETHTAVLVGPTEARLLEVPAGSPGMAARRVAYLAAARPLEFVQSIMRGDRYEVVLDLVNPVRTS